MQLFNYDLLINITDNEYDFLLNISLISIFYAKSLSTFRERYFYMLIIKTF